MPPERTTLGRYALVRRIGRGGMAEVWEALLQGPAGFQKAVALKVLPAGRALRDDERHALIREARLGALLHHPNVVSVLELGQEAAGLRRWFVSMELVRGPSVSALRHRLGVLPLGAVLDIAIQTCAGLAHIHGAHHAGRPLGLVHRDIKPGNLLVDPAGLVKIADFGIAILAADLGGDPVAGTPRYIAPEQRAGAPVQRSDLYALGRVIQRLCGQQPTGVASLDAAVARCLELDPDRRWPSATELGAALKAIRSEVTGPGLVSVLADTGADPGELLQTGITPTMSVPGARAPVAADRFVGRDAELVAIEQALVEGRLVTLQGPGGAGKTRLSMEVARQRGGAAVWCECASATGEDGFVAAVARGLGLPAGRDLGAAVGSVLGNRGRTLLILDNLEQIIEPAATWGARWLEGAPQLQVLATSRIPLRIRGERIVAVGPMTPDDGRALFLDRARAGTSDDGSTVDALVRQLDGLPLALELAAARTRLMTPAQVLAALADRFRVLSRGRRGNDRHRTLRATLDGSWQLLDEVEQAALAQLSVFVDGFDLAAADAVLELPSHAPWTLDVLSSLLDHSLVRLDGQRFSMLLAVRDYAAEHLDGLGEAARAGAELRHAEHYAALSDDAFLMRALNAADSAERGVMLVEAGNVVAAARRMRVRSPEGVLPRVIRGALRALLFQGRDRAALGLIEDVVDAVPSDPDLRRTRSFHRRRAGLFEAALEDASIALDQATTDADRVWALSLGTEALLNLRRLEESHDWGTRGLALASRIGEPMAVARLQGQLGETARALGRLDEARERLEAAVQVLVSTGDRANAASCLGNLAVVYAVAGEYGPARRAMEKALASHLSRRNLLSQANARSNLAILSLIEGDVDQVRVHIREGRAAAARIGLDHARSGLFTVEGDLLALQGDEAGALACYDLGLEHTRWLPEKVTLRARRARMLARLGRRDEATRLIEAVLADSRARRDPMVLGYVLVPAAEVAGPGPEAAAMLDEAVALREALGQHPEWEWTLAQRAALHLDLGDRARAAADVESVLDRQALADALTRGLAWALDAQVCLGLGNRARAEGSLKQAEAVRELLRVGPRGPLARRIGAVQQALRASRAELRR